MRGLTVRYVLQRVGMFFLTVWIGATLIYIIPRLVPGDPVGAMISRMTAQAGRVENQAEIIAQWRARFGLDAPPLEQYLSYMGNLLRGDLNYSLSNFPSTVSELIGRSLPWTIGLLSVATVISFILGNVIGALMGWRRTPKFIKSFVPVTLIFTSVPFFMLGLLLIYVFVYGLRIFPPPGGGAANLNLDQGFSIETLVRILQRSTLPAVSIIVASMGFWALGMRGMMITTDGDDFLILAQAKGLSPTRVFLRYSVRNAVLPQVTALALSIGGIVAGSILVEFIFSYPGTGYLLYQGLVNGDYTLIQGVVIVLIIATAFAVLLIDLLYPLIDPRITYQKR
jgi:peptide/nickel transport system permease protein